MTLLQELESLSNSQFEKLLSLLSIADDVPGPQAEPGLRKTALARWGEASTRQKEDVLAALAMVRSGKPSVAMQAKLWPHHQRTMADRMPLLMHRTGDGHAEVRLRELWIEVELAPERMEEHSEKSRYDGPRLQMENVRSLDAALQLAQRSKGAFGTRGVVLVGMPGSGKSTLLKKQLWEDGTQAEAPTLLLRFSVLQKLGLQNLNAESLRVWAAKEAEMDGFSGAAEALLSDPHRPYRFLLDGFDELARPEDRRIVVRWLRKHVFPHWNEADFVITTRRAAWEEEDRGALTARLHAYTLLGLRADAVRRYIGLWFVMIARFELQQNTDEAKVAARVHDYRQRGERLIAEILDSGTADAERVRRLLGNPLLLSIVCLIYRQHGRLPRNRADLYDKCLEVLIYGRRIDGNETGFSKDVGIAILGPVAWELQQSGDGQDSVKEMEKEEILRILELAKDVDSEVRDISGPDLLDRLHKECALLMTADQCNYSFSHLTFQEYLAFQYAVRERKVEELARAANEPRWQEPILLGMSHPQFQRDFFGELTKVSGRMERLSPQLLEKMILEKKSTTDFEARPFVALLERAGQEGGPTLGDLRVVLDIFRRGAQQSIKKAAETLCNHADATVAGLAAVICGREVITAVGKEPKVGDMWTLSAGGQRYRFLWVPGGEFFMGASRVRGTRNFDKEAYDDESPVQRTVVAGFWMARHPVTNVQYRAFVRAKQHREPDAWRQEGFDADAQPVTGVHWADAMEFCKWMSEITKTTVFLPTEAQWERAARGEDGRRYPWGNERPTAEHAVFGGRGLATVGGRPSGVGPYGHHDLAGNVWEWTQSMWGTYVSGAKRAVSGEESLLDNRSLTIDNSVVNGDNLSDAALRVVRGGAWHTNSWDMRAAIRGRALPNNRNNFLGFRVCVRHEPVP